MRLDLVVGFEEACHVIESRIVEFEGLEESFDLALRGRFSSGPEDMLDAMRRAEVCEPAWAVVAPILRAMIREDLLWGSRARRSWTERVPYLRGICRFARTASED